MKCAEIREVIPAYERDSEANLTVRRHLLTCSACREEMARYKELRSGLSDLRMGTVDVPAELTRTLFSIPSDQNLVSTLRTHVARNRRVYVGGAAAALAAGAAGAVLWRSRSRRLATA